MIHREYFKKGLTVMGMLALVLGISVCTGCNNQSIKETIATITAEEAKSGVVSEEGSTVIELNTDSAQVSGDGVQTDGNTVTVKAEGTYILRGSLNGCVIVEAAEDAEVNLVLDGAEITNEGDAAIYVKSADRVTITLAAGSSNILASAGDFTDPEGKINGTVYSKEDLTVNGSGSLTVTSEKGHGIVSKDDLIIDDGSITVDAAKDGLHAKETLTVEGGSINIKAAEGLESTGVVINDGEVTIEASDDGINASQKDENAGTPYVEINGGTVTITMASGDTDGIDANGNIYINGGTVNITARSPFDYDKEAVHNGGTIIVNGEEIDEITNQFGGEGGGFEQGGRNGENAPEGFEPGNLPEGFEPGNMPEGFEKGDRPERPDGGNRPEGGGKRENRGGETDDTI